jgi:sec-independent protein translocase protein TatA
MLGSLGTTEIVVIGLVLLMLFGGKKLPQLSKGVADSVREFKKAANESA